MSIRRLSLRARLLLGVVVLAAAGLVAADVATYTSLRSFLLHRVDQSLDAGHPQVEQTAFPRPEPARPGPARGPGPPAQGIDWYQVRTLDGRALRGGFLIQGGSPPKLPGAIAIPARATAPDGERATYLTVPARSGGGRYRVRASIELQHPTRVLVIATSLSSVDGTLHRLLVIELLVTGGVLVAIAGLGLWAVWVGLRPLRAIETTAAAIAAGDLTRRVERAEAGTEVGRLGIALNTMLAQIESAFRAREASESKLRRFVADASHELRTPLAAVRAYAELFSRGASARPDDLARSMSGISREAERMSLLVEDLLLLARLDEGRPLEQEPVELAEIVAEAVDAARVVEPERPFELELEPVTVTGDRDRLRQIVDNLLANARAHTPAATPVRVTVRRVDGTAEISVADSGPGLDEQQLSQVFERFYRADASRARAAGGAGLGLSIVAAVARAHGGGVSAGSPPGEGATFTIQLPLAAERDDSASAATPTARRE
jgi:two-component system, OmpR family, sensor kinase